jgi:hypothetical protein
MYATCFGLYLCHPYACQYKEHVQEDITGRLSIFPYMVFVLTCLWMT